MIDVVNESGHPLSEMRKSGWIGIRISESDKQLLQTIAESEGRSLANLCLFIIREYVERHTRQTLASESHGHKISHPQNPDTETVKNEAKTRAKVKAGKHTGHTVEN